ncbi:hypothetical protein SDC9_124399 [bioreactor metagenome]|uniref:Holin n=1 Tax=bioreactor metagenome TaxID=1076179 RepID=A0A645CKA4_9ZZZZ|nr:hypothetical protein [Oscillospiraceae bacterium]
MINWKQKLSSRKLWAGIIAALGSILTAIFSEQLDEMTVELVKTAVIALCVYIGGESFVDIARAIFTAVGKTAAELSSAPPGTAAPETAAKINTSGFNYIEPQIKPREAETPPPRQEDSGEETEDPDNTTE